MKKGMAVAMATLLAAFVVSADLVTFDFTLSEYQVLAGQSSYTINNAQGSGIDLAFSTANSNQKISWNTNAAASIDRSGDDGLGVYTNRFDDEITGGTGEMLIIAFDPNVTLKEIMITDLFIEGNPSYAEVGFYRVNEQNWVMFTAVQPTGTNGELAIKVDYHDVTKVAFKSNNNKKNDFSVRGLTVSVPEPGALSLLGIGLSCLMGLAAIRRKK